jgi:hypothetical protein
VGEPEHAVGFFPFQSMLDVDCRLGLHDERNETEDQEKGCVDVLSSGLVFRDREGRRS